MNSLSLYVHIPFCTVKCPFCDFYTRPHRNTSEQAEYTEALLHELTTANHFAGDYVVSSIYFGGGTPSLLEPKYFEKLLAQIRHRYSWTNDVEITLEINPEDLSPTKLSAWKDLGINRFSLGIEALSDAELSRLGRAGRKTDNERAINHLTQARANFSVDLIFGLENQTLEDWMHTLQNAVTWNPAHFSCYNLTIEPKTRYAVERKSGSLHLPEESIQAEMFLAAHRFLMSKGYGHYEISNYAKPGFESKHNLSYWNGQDYWGLGVSAHSFIKTSSGGTRFWHPRSYRAYIENPRSIEKETLSPKTYAAERVMLSLRKLAGFSLSALEHELKHPIDVSLKAALQKNIQQGFIEAHGDTHRFTEQGLLFSDSVFEDLM